MNTTTRRPSAVDRRTDAIGTIGATLLDPATSYEVRTDVTRESAAAAVTELMALGRTGRWITAILTWKTWILDTDTDLRWAIVQGSIGAQHAAD